MNLLILLLLLILLFGALPAWPYSQAWGPYPASGIGFILLVVLILVLLGRF